LVNIALSLGALVGVSLSGAFLYLEIGRYAAPQVPRSLFDERKELFAYTAGLFGGVLLALPWLLFMTALVNGGFVAAAIDLSLLVIGTEIGQWLLLRSRYFGSDAAGAFYALGFRAGVAGILILAVVTQYFGGAISAGGIGLLLATSVAILVVQVAASLLSLTAAPQRPGLRGSSLSGAIMSGLGLLLIAIGWTAQGFVGAVAVVVAIVGGGGVYFRARRSILSKVRAPGELALAKEPTAFGRVER
jgi:hypothetical protein